MIKRVKAFADSFKIFLSLSLISDSPNMAKTGVYTFSAKPNHMIKILCQIRWRMSMYDVLVIGGGPAGLTAALYASRQGFKTALVTIDIGGQLIMSPRIENFPALPPLSGYELANNILEQVKELGCELVYDEAVKISEKDDGFTVHLKSGQQYDSKTIILAIGKKPRKLNVPGEEKFSGRGVSYCAVCDAPLYREKKVAVVGWGEPAYEAVSILRKYGNQVFVIFPGRASGELADKIREMGSEIIDRTKVVEVKGDLVVKSITLENLDTKERKDLEVDGVFVEMGYIADTSWVKDLVKINENGEIVVDKLCRTSRDGIFAAGDVTDMPYKQAVIAAAQGAIAALSASNYLMKLAGKPEIKSDWRKLTE